MKKYVLFTHDDLDGAGCRIIFECIMQMLCKIKEDKEEIIKEYDVINCANSTVDTKVQKYINEMDLTKKIEYEFYFGDIVCERNLLNKLNEIGSVSVLDHHPTNLWVYQEKLNGIIDIKAKDENDKPVSGTSVLYERFWKDTYYFNPLMDLFVDTVRSYDTYEFKETNNIIARQLQVLFVLLGMDRFCNKYISKLMAVGPNTHMEMKDLKKELISENDMEFVSAKLDNEKNIIDTFTPDNVVTLYAKGFKIAFIYWPSYANTSELCNRFLEKYKDYDIFITFTLNDHGGEFSLRTLRENIKLGEDICNNMGGGGHPKAAGFPSSGELNGLVKSELIREVFLAFEKCEVFNY